MIWHFDGKVTDVESENEADFAIDVYKNFKKYEDSLKDPDNQWLMEKCKDGKWRIVK